MSALFVRPLSDADLAQVVSLYRAAAAVPGSGLAREEDEIGEDYVRAFIARAGCDGITLGAFIGDELAGEIHAVRIGPRQFAHVLGDLTVAVRPSAQGRGIGTTLFDGFLAAARGLEPKIERIELLARSGNEGALRLYERLGFVREGRLIGRVRLPDGSVEDDIFMALRVEENADLSHQV